MANLRSAPLFENLQEIQAQRSGCIFAEGRSFLPSPFPLPSRCSQKRTYNTLFTLFQSGFLLPRGRGFFGELFRGNLRNSSSLSASETLFVGWYFYTCWLFPPPRYARRAESTRENYVEISWKFRRT